MKKHFLPISLIAATLMIWLTFYSRLPDQLPIHWSINDHADGFASKLNAMLLSLGIMVFMYAILVIIPKIDPKRENYKSFTKGYSMINFSTLVLFSIINLMIICSGLGYEIQMNIIIPFVIGVLFTLIGLYMPNVKISIL
ncbi:DUF1648 domain-containing protein [Peribacillus sp. SCS-155]|uniref:DUF1648 domain-containing protein n=1 Tax=Peribacillus sedimenti TaxID=3115297 RepID=UPI003906C2BA